MITDSCQRWELGREHRRPAGETIRTAEYEVTAIAGTDAKTFVEAHHYAGSCSPTAHPFGLFRHGTLSGVAVFGPLASMNAHRAVFPTLSPTEGVTLGRLVLLDGVPGNGESYFVARCFALLRAAGIVAVESCADPEPRAARDGRRVHRGHVGTVYQSTNGRYVGKTNPATLRLLPDGTVFSNRSSGKVVPPRWGAATPAPSSSTGAPSRFKMAKIRKRGCSTGDLCSPRRCATRAITATSGVSTSAVARRC